MSKGLEALQYLDDIAHGRKMDLDAHELKLIVEKELRALEIIKKKKVNMISLLSSIEWHNPSHYNDSVGCPIGCELTQEEYDLLKEVLL